MRFTLLPVSLLALALAGCGSADEPAAEETTAAATPAPLPSEIPAEFQGRWGLTDKSCTAENSEGLLEVTATEIKFYESVGKLESVTAATNGRVRGTFAFTGEGDAWQRDVVFDLRSEGQVLIRREFGEGASPEPFDYTRCE